MAIRSHWSEEYTSSDPTLHENMQQSLYALHEQLMEMSGIKLVYDTETHLWGWEGITFTLKGQKSDIKHPNRTIAILDATSKILNAHQYNQNIVQKSPAQVSQTKQVSHSPQTLHNPQVSQVA